MDTGESLEGTDNVFVNGSFYGKSGVLVSGCLFHRSRQCVLHPQLRAQLRHHPHHGEALPQGGHENRQRRLPVRLHHTDRLLQNSERG